MKSGELGRVYRNGENICTEGERGEVMFVIQSGKVRITKQSPDSEIHLATLQSGDMFGEMAIFDKLPRSATATAQGDARVLSIDKKKLLLSITHDPTLAFKLLETMSSRIRKLDDMLAGQTAAKTELRKIFF